MSYKTVEVELENGRVHPSGVDFLPAKAHALLTLLDAGTATTVQTCGELAECWSSLKRLPADEAKAFADDVESARAKLPALKSAWD